MQLNTTSANSKAPRKQAKKPKGFTLWAKTALVRHGLTVKDLASRLDKSRGAVSLAINHPTVLPAIVAQIKEALK